MLHHLGKQQRGLREVETLYDNLGVMKLSVGLASASASPFHGLRDGTHKISTVSTPSSRYESDSLASIGIVCFVNNIDIHIVASTYIMILPLVLT